MKDEIYEFIQRRSVSFAELSRCIEGFKGDMQWRSGENKNIIYWTSISNEGADALEALIAEKKITMKPCHFLVYMCDGMVPDLPMVKRNYKYKTPHWLPITFDPLKGGNNG